MTKRAAPWRCTRRPARLAALLLSCAAWLLAAGVPAQAQNKELIAVLDLRPVGASDVEASAVTDRLREELLRTGRFTLVDRSQMDAVLGEQALQQAGCTEQECAVQVGQLLGVRKIVAGKLTRISPELWQLSAIMVDVETAETVRAESIQHRGDFFGLLTAQVPPLAVKLTGNGGPVAAPPAPVASPEPSTPGGTLVWSVYVSPLTTHTLQLVPTGADTLEFTSHGLDLAGHLEFSTHWGVWLDLQGGELAALPATTGILSGDLGGSLLALDYTWHRDPWSYRAGGGFYRSTVKYTINGGTPDSVELSVGGLALAGGLDYAFPNGVLLGGNLMIALSTSATGTSTDDSLLPDLLESKFSASRVSLYIGYRFGADRSKR
jgi:hypothetical protein